MEVFFKNQTNLMTFVVLAFVLVIALKRLDKSDSLNKAFLLAVAGVMLGLLLESGSVVFNGNSSSFIIAMNNIFSAITFAVAPMISFYFFVFIFRLVLPGKRLDRIYWILFSIPVLSNVILSILSPFFGFFFSISAEGIYSRGSLFILSAISTYIFMLAGLLLVLLNFYRMLRQDFWLILLIGIIPVMGGIIQSRFYGVLAMWSSAGVALLLGYLFLQDRMIRLDSLTGAWNRESFYFTFSRRIQINPEKKFGAIYFDIDNLKFINDNFGHLEGDKAIKLAMNIIREVLPLGSIICRLGGDEFIILCDFETKAQIDSQLAIIKEAFKNHEMIKNKEYELACSFGSALYTSEYASLNAFLTKLDMLMYQEKFAKKS